MKTRSERSFPSAQYLHAKAVWRGVKPRKFQLPGDSDEPGARPFGGGRDPRALGSVLDVMARQMGWSTDLEQARVIASWPEFVGERMAAHAEVTGISDGVILVQCDSTAWATELRRLKAQLVTRMLEAYPEAQIRDIKFLAPGAPSWRHGPRTVRGRGPRDTYG